MVFAAGDTHGHFPRFDPQYFPKQEQMTRDDYMINYGDFGGVWDGSSVDDKRLDWLDERPFTALFVDENHDILNALPVEDWYVGQ